MNRDVKSSVMPSKKIKAWLPWAFVILGFVGFLDTSYLTVNHFTGTAVNCTITEGCDEVLASEYSEIFGVPMALLGLLYYLFILLAGFFYLDTKNIKVLKILTFITSFGFLFSLWLVYLQFFIIKAICQYCMLSAINSTILMILGLILIPHWWNEMTSKKASD